jgi:hypothetical protein
MENKPGFIVFRKSDKLFLSNILFDLLLKYMAYLNIKLIRKLKYLIIK